MTFKEDWEKTDQQIELPSALFQGMIKQAFPSKKLKGIQVIAGGCVNLNVKIHLQAEPHPFILRIYLRDQNAAYQEQKLGKLLKPALPVPEVYFIGDYEGYRFALVKCLPGITLRDLLLSSHPYHMGQIMTEVGELLARIRNHHFSKAGFFDRNLEIVVPPKSEMDYLTVAKNCLLHPTVVEILGPLAVKVDLILKKNRSFFPDIAESFLVHGDFDPSNLLVDYQTGKWKISGILDWEFSFSGSPLWDIANMLRYAPQMPSVFETSFIESLEKHHQPLPQNWRISVHLLNILSLLDCLVRSQPLQQPNRINDIYHLIHQIIQSFD